MIGWIDGAAGASGDMLLGTLVGAGVPLEVMQDEIDRLDLGIAYVESTVDRGGLAATKVDVRASDTTVHRRLDDVTGLLASTTEPVRVRAESTFRRLAVAEAAVHGIDVDEVHFHEVGALDAIADVVGVCAGFVALGLDALHCSTLSLGSGQTRGAHGPIPIPAPAVVALLTGVAPVASGPAPFESTTPTGAALLAEWVDVWGPMPPMMPISAAAGAGATESDAVVNATRLVVGEPADDAGAAREPLVELVANVDDVDPRVWPSVIGAALDAGALDAWLTPILMKKGRPAHTFTVLCAPTHADRLRRTIFEQTSTLGVRERSVVRTALVRTERHVEVDGRTIRVKEASLDGEVVNRSVEWDDVEAAATALGRPVVDVLRAAEAAATSLDA